jgi:predicted dithiol-disulfide oxidoreductase (DUF899 family)
MMDLPQVVSYDAWQAASAELLAKEKAATRARDALNAARRRLPMAKVEKSYVFEGPDGSASLLDLFDGRRQLILYHFMFGPSEDEGCVGCSMFADNIGHLAHMHARDTSLALVSRAPLSKLASYKARMGWSVPWFSAFASDFNQDFGLTTNEGETHGLSVFIRDSDSIFRTYFTNNRGTELLGSTWSFLDLTPLGRQEQWEDSPAGRPQTPPYEWWRRHDKYAS